MESNTAHVAIEFESIIAKTPAATTATTTTTITNTSQPIPVQNNVVSSFEKQQLQLPQNESVVSSDSKESLPSVSSSKGGKHNIPDKKIDEKTKMETDLEVTELLGSVTTQNCPGTRTSARVIQKMKQDQTRPLTPPPTQHERDHKKDDKGMQKTPSQVRSNKPTWTNLERNYFFDALNEFGKDFESLGNFINAKLKRRNATDVSFKTKDQVRQHYYQTYHKICKYIRFSDEIKKPAQEIYALVNYGEMRRKLQFVTDKHFMKLKHLVYQGIITVRCKGKNIRIKTPSCKALRRLNQLDDSLEDIRLPSKIEVWVCPANMESFGRVQSIAQNPRARVTVPLHKKLVNFIKTFQCKWRSHEMKLALEETKLFKTVPNASNTDNTVASSSSSSNNSSVALDVTTVDSCHQDAEMCFLPKPGIVIHRPLVSITEYLSSVNMCLTAYEERMGVKVRSETLTQERGVHANSKRQRTESGSEKRSPESKKVKQQSPAHDKILDDVIKEETATLLLSTNDAVAESSSVAMLLQPKVETVSGDELFDEINELIGDTNETVIPSQLPAPAPPPPPPITNELSKCETSGVNAANLPIGSTVVVAAAPSTATTAASTTLASSATAASNVRTKRGGGGGGGAAAGNNNSAKTSARSALIFKPLLSDDVIKRIRRGWTVSNAADITIGDLYVVLGQDSKLELDYYWCDRTTSTHKATSSSTLLASSAAIDNNATQQQQQQECQDTNSITTVAVASASQKQHQTQQNGLPYNPIDCDDPKRLDMLKAPTTISNRLKHLLLVANLTERVRKRQCTCGHTCERNAVKTRIERDLAAKSFKSFVGGSNVNGSGIGPDNGATSTLFRQPIAPLRRPILNLDPVKQLTTLTRQKMSRQVLVQRMLLPGGGANQSYDLLDVKNLQNNYVDSANKRNSSSSRDDQVNSINNQTNNNNTSRNNNNNNASNAANNCSTSTATTQQTQTHYNSMSSSPTATTNSTSSSSSLSNSCTPLSTHCNTNQYISTNNTQHTHSANKQSNNNIGDEFDIESIISMRRTDSDDNSVQGSSSMPDSAFDDNSSSLFNGMMSPMHLLRDSTSSNSRWLEENLNDFSLTSLLGHLDEINATRDLLDPSSNLSVISESSVDYRHKFQEITALMQSQDKD